MHLKLHAQEQDLSRQTRAHPIKCTGSHQDACITQGQEAQLQAREERLQQLQARLQEYERKLQAQEQGLREQRQHLQTYALMLAHTLT